MLNKKLLIVSDRFHNFAIHKNVITEGELYHLLKDNNPINQTKDKVTLIPGQGLNEKSIKKILELSNLPKNKVFFDTSLWNNLPSRAKRRLTHKHKPENILISEPKRASKNTFIMNLLIDENCEIMSDHQTGFHVQGMLLTEAARQSYMAIIEKFFFKNPGERKYFVFNNLNIEYNLFAFPLPAVISAEIIDINLKNPKKQNATMKIEVIQCGNCVASLSIQMTMMPNRRVALIESKLAQKSLGHYIDYLSDNIKLDEVANA